MPKYVLAIDNGTTSTRAILFDKKARKVSVGQLETTQIMPKSGWVEHDPLEIWANTQKVIDIALAEAGAKATDIAAIGITNQRETTIMWSKSTGKPFYNAIVWQDTRTQSIVDEIAKGRDREIDIHQFRSSTGLPLTPYFSASKISWLCKHVQGISDAVSNGDVLFGTPDTWILWNLTGGVNGGVHKTDVTNASRTFLMNISTLSWDDSLLNLFQVNRSVLPEIASSSEVFGHATGSLKGVPVSGILGDQQAATFGQVAFEKGDSKNTYGTGCFLIVNTGEDIVYSQNGLLTTVAYKIGNQPAHYALEGSVAVTGSLIQWLRDNLGIIRSADEVEALANTVADNGGAYFVPAFSGLFAPYWRSDARGAIVGLTRFVNKGHIARAALEAVAFQNKEVLDAVLADTGIALTELKVDGGMVQNNLLMQFQSDLVGVPVIRPSIAETTALGAAFAAGLAVGFWSGLDELRALWVEDHRWTPHMTPDEREKCLRVWKKAVEKSLDWVDEDSPSN